MPATIDGPVLVTGGSTSLSRELASHVLLRSAHEVRLIERPGAWSRRESGSSAAGVAECALDDGPATDELVAGVKQLVHVEPHGVARVAREQQQGGGGDADADTDTSAGWLMAATRCTYNLLLAAGDKPQHFSTTAASNCSRLQLPTRACALVVAVGKFAVSVLTVSRRCRAAAAGVDHCVIVSSMDVFASLPAECATPLPGWRPRPSPWPASLGPHLTEFTAAQFGRHPGASATAHVPC